MLPIIDQIEIELHKIIPTDIYEEWMSSPNIALDLKSPRELLIKRQFSKLWSIIYESHTPCKR